MTKRIKEMLLELILIMAGILVCTTVFCTIFFPYVQFGIDLLWQMVALAFICTVPGFVFVSKKELAKNQMLVRHIIHLCVLLALLLFFAFRWRWIDAWDIVQIVVFIVMFVFVYIMVSFFSYEKDKKVANKLNERLERFKQRKPD